MFDTNDSNKSWDIVDGDLVEYNERQYKTKYRSTDFVISCLKRTVPKAKTLSFLDVGCGGGANLGHIAKEFKNHKFHGIDINNHFIEKAIEAHEFFDIENTTFEHVDFLKFDREKKYDIVGSSQFLEVLDMGKADVFKHLCFDVANEGVYFQALFTEKDLEYEINIFDYNYKKAVPYNIYSISNMQKIADIHNFDLKFFKRFIIDIDLPDNHKGRGTYTIKKEGGERMMFSDVLHLPWYFLYFQKRGK